MVWSPEEEQIEALRLAAARRALLAGWDVPRDPTQRAALVRHLMLRPGGSDYLRVRKLFIIESLGLCVTTARRFANRGVDHRELVAAGQSGLMDAVDYWEPRQGIRFSAYAVSWIRSWMQKRLQDENRLARIRVRCGQETAVSIRTYEIDLEQIARRRGLGLRLRGLSTRTRQLLTAIYARGKTQDEAGAELQIDGRSVRRLHRRALRRLRIALGRDE